ncbi:myelin gene regulatory factor-like A [Oppia nitens]|uniref:myelin gene regulatory factor-like A n=1 Tax=Oppia nitens TaxID=1686743 RepID=UPI0023DA7FCE|nr:myelin gene regulatory factor-like A [Oppia nitens]
MKSTMVIYYYSCILLILIISTVQNEQYSQDSEAVGESDIHNNHGSDETVTDNTNHGSGDTDSHVDHGLIDMDDPNYGSGDTDGHNHNNQGSGDSDGHNTNHDSENHSTTTEPDDNTAMKRIGKFFKGLGHDIKEGLLRPMDYTKREFIQESRGKK